MIIVNDQMPRIAYKDGSRNQLAAYAGAFMAEGAEVSRHIICTEPGASIEAIQLTRSLERVAASKYSWLPTKMVYSGYMPYLSRKVPAINISAAPGSYNVSRCAQKLREMPCQIEEFDKEGVAMMIETLYGMGFIDYVDPWSFTLTVGENLILAAISSNDGILGISYQVNTIVTDVKKIGDQGARAVTRSFESWFEVTAPGYSINEIAGVILEKNEAMSKGEFEPIRKEE